MNKTYGKISTILSILGSVGVVATAVAASKATIKAASIFMDDTLDIQEKIKKSWRFYIVAAGLGVGTVICIVGSNLLNKKQQASLISAYSLLKETHQKYISGVRELYGEDAHQQVLRHINAEEANPPVITGSSFFDNYCLDFADSGEKRVLFYEPISKRYFWSTLSKVLQAEYHLNRNHCIGWTPCVNDFYEFLGLKKTDKGEHLIFTDVEQDGFIWIDFDHTKILVDNHPCYVIESSCTPYYEIGASGYGYE